MKYEPSDSKGEHQEMDAGEQGSHGSTGPEVKGKEFDKDGNEAKGGGYYMKSGKLYKMAKSESEVEIDQDDLQKSLDKLEDFAKSENTISRKELLLLKAQGDDGLSKSENDELFQILGGGESVVEDSVSDSLTKSMSENESLQEAVDVSTYLEEHHTELVKSLTAVGEEIEKSDNRRQEFNMILAKAVSDIGNLVKGIASQVGYIAEQPVRGPKSRVSTAQPLSKSFAGTAPEGESLTKGQVLDTLDAMMEKSMADGSNGNAACGEDIAMAVAKYEQTQMVSPALLGEIKAFRNQAVTH